MSTDHMPMLAASTIGETTSRFLRLTDVDGSGSLLIAVDAITAVDTDDGETRVHQGQDVWHVAEALEEVAAMLGALPVQHGHPDAPPAQDGRSDAPAGQHGRPDAACGRSGQQE